MSCIDSIAVYPKTKTIEVGKWYDGAHAEVCPVDAPCRSVVWSSDNTSVATVNPTLGEIWGESLGTARIYATATDGSGISGYMTVTVVTTVPVESVRLNHSKLSIAKGHSSSLIAIVCPENATNPSLNWSSNNEGVATVVNGTISAISEGTAIITATAKDGSGKSASCTVTVTNGILVSSITVNPSEKIMTVGDSAFLSATVYPSNATKKSVCWRSDNPNGVTVNENSGLIVAQNPGTARIYATACDGGGAQGYCEVTVEEPIKVECVCVYPQKTTIAPNEKQYISAYVDPVIATKPYVTWKSSNTNIVTVEKISSGLSYISNAEIIGKNKGTATITATATDGSNKKSSCTVTVDPREKVIVQKDSHSFYVKFADEKIWKGIGIDLSNRQDNYAAIYPPNFDYDNYDDLIEEEQRYFDNIYVEENGVMEYKTYSVKQIAYLYLLDPLGIEYYMRNHACKYMNWGEDLFFKDSVYKEIFGVWPRLIEISSNNTIYYYPYPTSISAETRNIYYTDAEVLFGFHTILSWSWSDFIKTFLEGIFDWIMEESELGTAVQAYQILFHTGGILGGCLSYASAYAENYIKENIENDIQNKLGSKAKKCVHWAFNLVSILADSTFSAFKIPNPKDITIYNRISDIPDYLTIIDEYNGNVSMEEIIQICNMNQ